MTYLTQEETAQIIAVARKYNQTHALAIAVAFCLGLRVSEVLGIKSKDIFDGRISVKRLKRKDKFCTLQAIPPAMLEELTELAKQADGKLFTFSRQYADLFFKRYSKEAGIHPRLRHFHSLRHGIAMKIWDETKSLSAVQGWLGHKSAASSLIYLAENDTAKASAVAAGIKF